MPYIEWTGSSLSYSNFMQLDPVISVTQCEQRSVTAMNNIICESLLKYL